MIKQIYKKLRDGSEKLRHEFQCQNHLIWNQISNCIGIIY